VKPALSEGGRELLKVLAVGLLALGLSWTAQPSFHGSVLIGVAGLVAILAAALKLVAAYLPRLSLKKYLREPWGAIADAFVHAGLATFIASVTGWLALHDLSTWKSVLAGAIIGGLNAGLTAVEHAFTPGLQPTAPIGAGIPPPPPEPTPTSSP
jgi:FtsH-binding integral membrane protein